MASMQCFKEDEKEYDCYSYGKSSSTYQKPTSYSNSGYQQSHYETEMCYETKPGMMGYGNGHSNNPWGTILGHGTDHGKWGYGNGHNSTHGTMGYGSGHNTHGMMGYGNTHNPHGYGNDHMHKPGFNGLGSLGHVVGFGKKHEGHGAFGMGSSGCTTYKKQHRRRKGTGGYNSGSDCSDSGSDNERGC